MLEDVEVLCASQSIILPCDLHILFAALQPFVFGKDDSLIELLSCLSTVLAMLLQGLVLSFVL